MSAKKLNWTKQQTRAIDAAGSDILVTASAGTGKTAVLSERCVNLLADTKEPTDVSQILVLTFTNPAADQMRSRIAERLHKQFRQTRNSRLKHQLLLLDAAHISTIHAFCKRIITEHFYLLGLDPTFRIIDPDEQRLVKSEVLEKIIEDAWADSSLADGLKSLLRRRNLKSTRGGFLEKIITLSEFLDGVVSRSRWYERAAVLTEAGAIFAAELADRQKKIMAGKLNQCKSRLQYAMLLDQHCTDGGHFSGPIQTSYIDPVNQCIEYLQADDIDKCAELITGFSPPNFIRKPKDMSKSVADFIKAPALKAKDTLKKLASLAIINPDYERIVAPIASLQGKVMIELVKRFDRQYTDTKNKLNCLDFADLEHLTLALLNDNDSIAEKLRERFKYIFVDEYQDINAVQEAIVQKLSRRDNIFVVGDVKQSIYAFRQSRPEIFLKHLARAAERSDTATVPLRVDLSDNFRSRKGVLDFANAVFSRIMTASLASITYDEKAFLKPGFNYKPIDQADTGKNRKPLVEMYILNEEPTDDNDSDNNQPENSNVGPAQQTTAPQRQAAFIAKRIRQMVGVDTGKAEFQIYDKQTEAYRDVEYRDIVILMRSPAHIANNYVEILQLASVPVSSQASVGYFATTEITDCICLLKVLDNPQQDIELAALLRSPFFKLTDTQLAMIRLHCRSEKSKPETPFYNCLLNYSQNGPSEQLRDRLKEILKQIDNWRTQQRNKGLPDLLWRIFRQTGYLSFVSALAGGKQRRANLLKLHDRAIQFENFATSAQAVSLSRFIEFIEKLLAQGHDWALADSGTAAANAVRILSVHKSKGLEFPVVFLAQLDRRFNKKDSYGDCLIDNADAIGLQIVDPDSNARLTTIAHQVIAEKKLDITLAEEMRILYVAMTRARERMDWQLRDAQCHFDWLLWALGNSTQLRALFAADTDASAVNINSFGADLLQQDRLEEISNSILQRKRSLKTKPKKPSADKTPGLLLPKVKQSLSLRYPFEDLTNLPAKQSVSDLTHRDDEFARLNLTKSLDRLPKIVASDQTAADIDHKLIGTAAHLIIKTLDLSKDVSIDSIKQTISTLVTEDKISPATAEKVNANSIQSFFRSDLGKQALTAPEKVLREWPFTFAADATLLGAETTGQIIIVQGIIDMIIPTADGLIIIDFKTDNITAPAAPARAELYRQQMRYYSEAAQKVLNQKITKTYLYFLTPGSAVNVNPQL